MSFLGISSIFSIRDFAGKALTTFEVTLVNNRPALLRHSGYGNGEPPHELQAIARRFVHERLASLPLRVIAAVRAARYKGGFAMSGLLAPPDTMDSALSQDESAELAKLVAFAHPVESKHQGIYAFLRSGGHLEAFNLNPAVGRTETQ